jgi:hypothetical protein
MSVSKQVLLISLLTFGFKQTHMKHIASLFILALVALSCGTKTEQHHDHQHNHSAAGFGDALYDEVMKVHDEVMPKMNDIYTLKEELKKQLANSPDMMDEKRKELEARIANLEAASEGMMRWMREFNPPADSLGEEAMKKYLEGEMEKVKRVREGINNVLQ